MLSVVEAIKRANIKALEKNKPYAIVEMDCDEGRRIYIVPEEYTASDEFEAYEGEIIYITEEAEDIAR